MTNNTLARLTKIADQLDHKGQTKLADLVDRVIAHCGTCENDADDQIDELLKQMDEPEADQTDYWDRKETTLPTKPPRSFWSDKETHLPAEEEPTKEEVDAFMGEEE